MSFGYIGYVWTLCGCAALAFVAFGAAAALYTWARRARVHEPTTHVEEVGRDGPGGGSGAA